jgi:hypothetical protein
MSKCVKHRGRDGVMSYGGNYYCAKCRDGIIRARTQVGHDIDPRECFVVFCGGDAWEKIEGTGCAHWVAHERQIRSGGNDEGCLLGYTLRVEDLIAGLSTRSLDHARRNISVGEIYVTTNEGHCGLVVSVDQSSQAGGRRQITIRHDSSNSSGTGRGVVEDDFDEHFHGTGKFKW